MRQNTLLLSATQIGQANTYCQFGLERHLKRRKHRRTSRKNEGGLLDETVNTILP